MSNLVQIQLTIIQFNLLNGNGNISYDSAKINKLHIFNTKDHVHVMFGVCYEPDGDTGSSSSKNYPDLNPGCCPRTSLVIIMVITSGYDSHRNFQYLNRPPGAVQQTKMQLPAAPYN